MGGGGKEVSTSTSGPSNPRVTATQNKLLGGLDTAFAQGVKPFNKSLYPGVGETTQNSWAQTLGAAGNQDFASGIGGAISDFGDVAAGNRFGTDDPGYAALRAKAGEDTLRDVNGIFTGSGRFGSGSHVDTATESLGDVYAGLDYQNHQQDIARQQQALQLLPQAYQASLMPGAAAGAVGSAQDADALATRQGENDLFRRQNDTKWDALARASSIAAGTAGMGGTTTTNTQPSTPWWQVAGAGALGLGSLLF